MADDSDTARLDAEVRAASKALNACMLSEWKLCAAGVLLGMPVSMRYKTPWPFVFGGVFGSVVDWRNGTQNCAELSDALSALSEQRAALEE
jgi:hypothetical protein